MSRTVFVGNVNYRSTEEDLRDLFEVAGAVSGVTIPKDRETGRPRGFAFVEFDDTSSAASAIDTLDGAELDGRELRVSLSTRQERSGDRRPGQHRAAAEPRWDEEPEEPVWHASREDGKPRGGWREARHRSSRRHSKRERD